MMKRILLVSFLLLTLLLVLVSCDVIQVDVDTAINEDGSGTFTMTIDQLPNSEGECDEAEEGETPSVLVNTPTGPRCRMTQSIAFGNIAELETLYAEFEDAVLVSCLEMVDGIFYFDGALVLEDVEPSEEESGPLNIRFIVPGQVSNSNAHQADGNTLLWSIDSAAPPEHTPMLINMIAGDLCPSEAADGEPDSGEVAAQAEEASEEETSGEEEVSLNPLETFLADDLEDSIHARMGCSSLNVDEYTCERLISAADAAEAVTADVRSQIPDATTIAAQKAMYNIEEISIIAFSRDENGELIFPSVNASMPVIIQMAWNGMEFPQQAQAAVRYATMLIDYDNRRYAADHGE